MSSTGISFDVAREFRGICGDKHVVEQWPERSNSGTEQVGWLAKLEPGSGPPPSRPIGVVPASAEEVAAILRVANERGLRVFPAGGEEAFIPLGDHADLVLNTARLSEVEHYDHSDLTIGVGAGTTVAQLNAMVGADKLMFAADPPLPERCTIGGLLATAAHGPLRHGYGAVRDYCIGIRFVTGDGRCAKGGGRVVKNVAGYDLMKLLIGSYGTLAVITSASFKLFPAPRQTKTFLAEFATAKEALQFRDQVMRSPLSPMCLELVSPGARKLMRPEMTSDAWVICVRAAGSDVVLARYGKELGSAVTREVEGDDEKKLWRAIENFPVSAEGEFIIDRFVQRIHINVPPRDVIEVITILNQVGASGDIGVAFIGRVGVGHVLATAWPINLEVPWPPGVVVEKLEKNIGGGIGLKVEHGLQNPWPIAPADLASMRAVKHTLDPNNVLRGRAIF